MGHQKVHQGPQFHEAVLQGRPCQEQASLAAERRGERESVSKFSALRAPPLGPSSPPASAVPRPPVEVEQ